MWKEITGLVLKEQPVGEKEKIITVLTAEGELLRCFARVDDEIRAGSQPVCLSRMMVCRHAGGSLSARSFEPLELFPAFRSSEERFSLSQYFVEVVLTTQPEVLSSREIYQLLLRCLMSVDRKEAPLLLVKSCFELKYMALSGFMPSVLYCQGCGVYEEELMLFLCREGRLYCPVCCRSREVPAKLSREALRAMRCCLLSDIEEALGQSLAEQSLRQLSEAAETYLLVHTERKYYGLDWYRVLQSFHLPEEVSRPKSDKPLKQFHYIEPDPAAPPAPEARRARKKKQRMVTLEDMKEEDEEV